jgi:hypothetical protein
MLTKSLAYEKWLGIKAEHQPPSLYRLLAIDPFEADTDVIANAADSRIGFVRQFQNGENAKLSVDIANELARAQLVLLNPEKKAAYDAKLRASSPKPAASGSSKPQPGTRKHSRAAVFAVAAGATVLTGCLLGGSYYLFSGAFRTNAAAEQGAGNLAKANPGELPADKPPAGSTSASPTKPANSAMAPRNAKAPPSVDPAPAAKVTPPGAARHDDPPRRYDEGQLAKDLAEINRLSKAVKSAEESRRVAEQAIVVADRAIALSKSDSSKSAAVLALAAARDADSITLARQATVLVIQLQKPLSVAMREAAMRRLEAELPEKPAAEEAVPKGPSLRVSDEPARVAGASGGHEVKWGKTEGQRRKIYYDLLKAVDDFGMTPAGRKAWADIETRNGIDDRVTLGILNEGLSTFSDWEQPDGGGTASGRMNRMAWVGERTRSMSEPMLRKP